MLKTKLLLVLTTLLLTSCSLTGRETKVKVVDTSCDWIRPIYISKHDMLTSATARQILVHNKQWKKICDEANESANRSSVLRNSIQQETEK